MTGVGSTNTGCIKMIRTVLKLIIFTSMVNRIINISRNERVTQQAYDTYLQMFDVSTLRHTAHIEAIVQFLPTLLSKSGVNLHQDKFERAVIFCDSKAAILSAASTETKISREARDCQDLIRQLKGKHKQIALQWIPGHCQITGNEQADVLAKKGAKITQTYKVVQI